MTDVPKITHTIELLFPDGVRAVKLLFETEQHAQHAFEKLTAAFESETPICSVATAVSMVTIDTSKFCSIIVQEYAVFEMAHAQVRTRSDLVGKRYSSLIDALED